MSVSEETIAGTLDKNGLLQLAQTPKLPPGSVNVTIRVATPTVPRRGLVDVIREIAADQRARGFAGLSPAELIERDVDRFAEDDERDQELDNARRYGTPGGP